MKISNILRTDKTLDFSFYIIGWVCLILALVLGLAWKSGYFLWIFPPDGCVLHNLTGYYCPGCGGTRAIHALLHSSSSSLVQSQKLHSYPSTANAATAKRVVSGVRRSV